MEEGPSDHRRGPGRFPLRSRVADTVLVMPVAARPPKDPERWRLEVFATDDGAEPFTTFAENVDDFTWSAVDAALKIVLAVRGLELARTEWLKPLGGGLHEFRVRHDAAEIDQMFGGAGADEVTNTISPPRAILLRVFVHFYGDKVILLLSGYDKGRDPSAKRQEREIAQARKCLTAWNQQQKRQKAAGRGRAAGSRREGSSRR